VISERAKVQMLDWG